MLPRELTEKDGDIFKIIMPWVAEQAEEEKLEKKPETKAKPAGLDKSDELKYLSKVVKVGAVEEFNFEFADKDLFGDG